MNMLEKADGKSGKIKGATSREAKTKRPSVAPSFRGQKWWSEMVVGFAFLLRYVMPVAKYFLVCPRASATTLIISERI